MYQNTTPEYDGLKTITATFGIIVAAVVGYYFGQKPVESAVQRAEEASGQKVEYETKLDSNVQEDIEHISSDQEIERELQEHYKRLIDEINGLLRRL